MEISEIIENARKDASTPLIMELVDEFEGFAKALMALRAKKTASLEERQPLIEEMTRSYDRLKLKYIQVAASYGMGLEQFLEFLNNPKNFTPSSWADMQRAKRDVESILEAPSKKRKGKINKRLKNRA